MSTPDTLAHVHSYLVDLPAHERESIMSELQAHLEDKAADLRAQGHPDPDAAAQRAFGDPRQVSARLADGLASSLTGISTPGSYRTTIPRLRSR